jgi:hypothetical protein
MKLRSIWSRQPRLLAVALLGVLANGISPSHAEAGPEASPRSAWFKQLNWPSTCEEDWQAAPQGSGISQYGLQDGRQLIGVSCSTGPQGYQLYYLQSAEGVAQGPLRFPVYEDIPGGGRNRLPRQWQTEVHGQASFHDKLQELRVLRLKRAGGDCGTWASYSFDTTGPSLVELRAKAECDGQEANAPQRWQRQLVPH